MRMLQHLASEPFSGRQPAYGGRKLQVESAGLNSAIYYLKTPKQNSSLPAG